MSKEKLGILQVIAAALLWGTYGIFVKSLDIPPQIIIFYRYFFGFVGLLVFVGARDGFTWVGVSVQHWKWLYLPALFTGVSWLAYTYALKYTFIANAAFLTYTAPVFTVLFAPLIIKEKIESSSIFALVLALFGTLAIMGYNTLFIGEGVLTGDLYALAGGIVGGLIISFIKKVPPALSGYRANLIMSGMITMALLPFLLQTPGRLGWQDYLLLMAMGLIHQSLATTLFHTGLRLMKAQYSAVLSYIDPLVATIMAGIFLAETITIGSIIGGILIMVSGVIIVLRNRALPAPERVKA